MNRRLFALGLVSLFAAAAVAEESIQVTVVGTLKTGILAIGAETTGSTITAKGVTWELDFGKDAALRAAAEKLNGKQASVSGTLERRPGVEIKERWIVTVTNLKAADAARKPGSNQGAGIEASDFREGTTIAISAKEEKTIVDIRCERGIDRCVLTRTGDHWPESIALRLHLKGLESLQVSAGGATIAAENLKKPLDNGVFEVRLPQKLLAQNPAEVRLQWIDFYR